MNFRLTFTALFSFCFYCQPEICAQDCLPVFRFTDSIAVTSVKDQASSPTCWVFGTNSLFEADELKLYNWKFDLSEMFVARYAYIDKARRYLQTGGKTYFEGGGQFHDVIRVVTKYGIVPETVYPGKPASAKYHDHTKLDSAMQRLIRYYLRKGYRDLDPNSMKRVNDTLDKYLGHVPVSFKYGETTYTPLSFANAWLPFANDYMELVSFADQPLYKKFILRDRYNWASDSFYNITLHDMQAVADTALRKGYTLGWEGDVTDPGFRFLEGEAAIDSEPPDPDTVRLKNYETRKTERDHMLHICGLALDPQGQPWYYLKNSWGSWPNKLNGFIFMNSRYFRMQTVILFVNKNAFPGYLKKKLEVQ